MFCPSRTLILPLLLTFAFTVGGPAAAAESGEGAEPSRPLNLSLPRDVIRIQQGLAGEAASAPSQRDAVYLPDLGENTAGNAGHRGHLPYGSGYEARQRGGAFGGGMGGGRGVGRRR